MPKPTRPSSSRERGSSGLLKRWRRRLVTVPGVWFAWFVMLASLPLWLPAAIVVDLARGKKTLPAPRCCLFALTYLSFEIAGMLIAAKLWLLQPIGRLLGDDKTFERWNFGLQCWWGNGLTVAGCRIFDLDIELVEPLDLDSLRQRPIIVFVRHSSMMDTVLAIHVVQKPSRIQLRYVLKEQLLISPCLDIVGHRLRNWFARRGAGTGTDVEAIAALAEDLNEGEGVLIYPEGTRFSHEKRQRSLARARQRGDDPFIALATELEHTLVPKIRGPFALVRRSQQQKNPADILFCAHRGFEGSATLGQLFAGELIGKTIELAFWRVESKLVPETEDEFSAWLGNEWRRVERFVAGGASVEAAARAPSR